MQSQPSQAEYKLRREHRRECQAWRDMIYRCYEKKSPRYNSYGGRGIRVCKRWFHNFGHFLEDMGPRPSPKHSLDRIDNDVSYKPSNCRWATRIQQQRNTRRQHTLTYQGKTLHLLNWAEELGIPATVIATRIKRGWSIEDALSIPIWGRYKGAKTATINGKTQTVGKWIKELKIPKSGYIYDRIEYGWTAERALTTPIRTYKKRK